MTTVESLRQVAAACLAIESPADKVASSLDAWRRLGDGTLAIIEDENVPVSETPGRPARPLLVPPARLGRRGLGSAHGRAAFVHAIAHIEFNAINLAWDAVVRFPGMPADFYRDWASVAADEARHFRLLAAHLTSLGAAYGDFDAHDGLWQAARSTAHDCMVRMALVPRVLEARGLDVAPEMIERLAATGDARGADILRTILREEVAHVACGTRWFRYLCAMRGLDPDRTFGELVAEHMPGAGKGRLHIEARLAAGFSRAELLMLEKHAGRDRDGSGG